MTSFIDFARNTWSQPHVVPLTIAFGLATLLYVVTGRRHDEVISLMDQQRRIQDETFIKVIDAYEDERRRHDENVKQLQLALADAQKRYEDQMKNLETKKSQQIENLTKKYDEDPVGMARQIGAITGFPVVVGDK